MDKHPDWISQLNNLTSPRKSVCTCFLVTSDVCVTAAGVISASVTCALIPSVTSAPCTHTSKDCSRQPTLCKKTVWRQVTVRRQGGVADDGGPQHKGRERRGSTAEEELKWLEFSVGWCERWRWPEAPQVSENQMIMPNEQLRLGDNLHHSACRQCLEKEDVISDR